MAFSKQIGKAIVSSLGQVYNTCALMSQSWKYCSGMIWTATGLVYTATKLSHGQGWMSTTPGDNAKLALIIMSTSAATLPFFIELKQEGNKMIRLNQIEHPKIFVNGLGVGLCAAHYLQLKIEPISSAILITFCWYLSYNSFRPNLKIGGQCSQLGASDTCSQSDESGTRSQLNQNDMRFQYLRC